MSVKAAPAQLSLFNREVAVSPLEQRRRDYPATASVEAWRQYLPAGDRRYLQRVARGACGSCPWLSSDALWCSYQNFPAALNPVLMLVGMACMGMRPDAGVA